MGNRRRLAIAGVDVILDAAGRPRVIEVNDHPGGFALADAPRASAAAVAAVAAAIATRAAGGEACLVLPECFALRTPGGRTRGAVSLADAVRPDDDARTEPAVGDANALAAALRVRGVPTWIADARGLRTLLDGRRPPAVVLAGTSAPLPPAAGALVVNDPGARRVCGDKLLAERLLAAAAADLTTAAAAPAGDGEEALVVVKPRFGSGSAGVERMPAGAAAARRGVIVQRWVASERLRADRWEYRFDLRVLVVDGRAAATFARRAAAPHDLAGGDSPLSWLTTTGPRLDADALPARVRARLPAVAAAAERAVAVLDGALRAAADAPARPPGFARANALGADPLRIVPLAAVAS